MKRTVNKRRVSLKLLSVILEKLKQPTMLSIMLPMTVILSTLFSFPTGASEAHQPSDQLLVTLYHEFSILQRHLNNQARPADSPPSEDYLL